MVDLRAKPYHLSDEDIAWVESIIAGMTDEEKVGQIWSALTHGYCACAGCGVKGCLHPKNVDLWL
jgi:hypothetical protein